MRQTKIPPSERLAKEFREGIASQGVTLSEMIRKGAQLMLQIAAEEEVEAFLGRGT